MTEIRPCAMGKTSGCKLLDIQQRIALSKGRLSSRLSQLNHEAVKTPSGNIIKGLYIGSECPSSLGMVVFMVTKGWQDFQHMHLAQSIGLSVGRTGGGFSEGGEEVGTPFLFDGNAWGFTLKQICRGLDIFKMSLAESEDNLRDGVSGFLFNSQGAVNDYWLVKPSSGLTGNMAPTQLPHFMQVLANSATPHFSLLNFVPGIPDQITGEVIRIPLGRVQTPTCLRWPDSDMLTTLLKGTAPPEDVTRLYDQYSFRVPNKPNE